jgi:hypothetical protein
MDNSKYLGMTLNERLFVSGLMGEFDKTVKSKNKLLIVDILRKVGLDQLAAEKTAETIFSNPEKYGYKI